MAVAELMLLFKMVMVMMIMVAVMMVRMMQTMKVAELSTRRRIKAKVIIAVTLG